MANRLDDMLKIPAFFGNGKVKVKREDYELIDIVNFIATSLNDKISAGENVEREIEKLKRNYNSKGFDFVVDTNHKRIRMFFRGIIGEKEKYFAEWSNMGLDDGVVKEIYYNYLAHKAESTSALD